jgi:hypothetical protein
MRRAIALLAGGAALGAALARALRGRSQVAQEPPPAPDPRAGELRDKLAEAREVVAERDEAEGETGARSADEATAPGEDLAERRRKVHAHGHAVAGEMRRRSSPKRAKREEE